MAAATHRAAHQILEQGRIFTDPLALRILGQNAHTVAREAESHPRRRGMRYFIAARAHFAESMLMSGVSEREIRQVVVLGAGLDTFSYRNALGPGIRIFEVDHPATQAWKRRRLQESGIDIPANVTFVPVDFERDLLFGAMRASSFSDEVRTFFLWLGVVPYLSENAIRSTLSAVGALKGGAEIVFDYADPPESLTAEMQAAHQARAARVAALGEPWLSYFEPVKLAAMLQSLGYVQLDDLGPVELAARYWPGPGVPAPERGGHVIFAATPFTGPRALP